MSQPSTDEVLEIEDLDGHMQRSVLEQQQLNAEERHAANIEKFREIYQRSMKRICSNCGHVDHSVKPPVSCPNCHFEEKSVLAPKVSKMNRAERRRQEAVLRLRNRAMDKKLARMPKPVAG